MGLNIAVIFGGKSVEHEISIISAIQCMNAIDKNKYNIVPIFISKTGIWYTGKNFRKLENYNDMDKLLSSSEKIIIDQNTEVWKYHIISNSIFSKNKSYNIDIVFPIMHGSYGEDGCLQGLLSMMNIPYIGCDVLSSSVMMDKIATKLFLQSMNIRVLDYYWFHSNKWIDNRFDILKEILAKFSYPIIVKPSNLGSSIGVNVVKNQVDLENAIDLAIRLSNRVLIEPHITDVKEVNCAVLGDADSVEISVCEEPLKSEQILSYHDKYCNRDKNGEVASKFSKGMQSSRRKIPADIPLEQSKLIKKISRDVFINLNCNGMVRIDYLIDKLTNDIYLCELNAIPGSLAFYLWQLLGKTFTDITERLIELALKRYRINNNLISSYSSNIFDRNNQ